MNVDACIDARDVFRGARMKSGGYVTLGSKKVGGGKTEYVVAHRRAYEESFGPIPVGMHIHHTCENRSCVNPEHLVALTPKQHKQIHRSSHCSRGHAMTPENTMRPGGCRQCKSDRERVRVPTPEAKARKAECDRIRMAKPGIRERKAAMDSIRHARNRDRALAGGEFPRV